jgi:hypothetical protein
MTVAVKLPSRNFLRDRVEVEMLKTIAVFCGIGLIASLFLAAAGFDIGAGLM